jgi:predicted NUDIX family NTP pyrophosphohydrolase
MTVSLTSLLAGVRARRVCEPHLSAGLLLYRDREGEVEVLLAHIGGPFWASKEDHAWTLPKGLLGETDGNDLLVVAEREFAEEMGRSAPAGESLDLGAVNAGRKTNHIFARAGDFHATHIESNTFGLEWPRGSDQTQSFPEVDRAAWFSIADARTKLVKGLLPFLDLLVAHPALLLKREAGRGLVVAPSGRTLMIRGVDPGDTERGGFWFTPGGGLDPGESVVEGTIRELSEELGLDVDTVGPIVMKRCDEFPMAGRNYRQTETIFLVAVADEFVAQPRALEAIELSVIREFRWLSASELRALDEAYYPRRLAELLDSIAADGPPVPPWAEDLTAEG